MKQDKLEKFITENRQEFDDLVPDPKIWDHIQENIEPQKKIRWINIMWKAAAVLIIFTASYFFHDYINQDELNHQTATVSEEEIDPENAEVVETLLEAEAYYTAQINNRKREVFQLAGNNRQLINDINIEFEELDQVLKELKNDLKDYTGTEEIIEAMIQNYRLKLAILEDMLYQLREAESYDESKEQSYEHEI